MFKLYRWIRNRYFKKCFDCRNYLPLFLFKRVKNKYLINKASMKGRVFCCYICNKDKIKMNVER